MSHHRLTVLFMLLLLPFAGMIPPTRAATSAQPLARFAAAETVADQVLVGIRPDSALFAQSTFAPQTFWETRWRIKVQAAKPIANSVYQINLPSGTDQAAALAQIAADPDVLYAEPNAIYRNQLRPNDTFYDRLYGLEIINAPGAWDITTGRPEVLVAVVDTGIYGGHPDFGGKVINGYDFVNGDANASDDQGHGTHTAGIVGAVGNNGRGVAGVCWQCRLLPVKVLNNEGLGTTSWVAQGIRYAADQGAKIINLSLGGTSDSRTLHDAVIYATQKGALVVAAAGNEGDEGNPVEYPAAYDEVIAVGASDSNDNHPAFSNFGFYVDVAAPGVGIGSTLYLPNDPENYGPYTGTSEAAPHVAGLAGLIWSINPGLNNQQVRDLILNNADDRGQPGRDDQFGNGRINAQRAVSAAIPSTPPPPPPPPTGDVRTFPETGHTLRGEFLRFWEENGGLPVFGYPITEEQRETTPEGDFLVQYFERNRFEFHPEKTRPYNVLLGRLGDTLLRRGGTDWPSLPRVQPAAGCQHFTETGHNVCGNFLNYWRSKGLLDPALDGFNRSLGLFGLPLTEPRMEKNAAGDTVLTQWFERARFEDHGTKGVLLGLLGRELLNPPSPCPFIPPSRNGAIRPAPCLGFGTEMSIDINGFAPNETVSFWLTAPDNAASGGQRTIQADGNGALFDLRYPSDVLIPGLWFWVFQGEQSGHQAVVYFYVYQ